MATIKSNKQWYEEYKAKNSSPTTSTAISNKELYKKYNAANVAKDIQSRLTKLGKDSQSLLDGYNSRFFDKDGKYITDVYRSSEDAGNWLYDVETRREALETEGSEIKKLLADYGEYFDKDMAANINSILDGNVKVINGIVSDSLMDKEYWDKFEDENAWKEVVQAQKEYADMSTADLGSLKSEIDELEKLQGMYNRTDAESRIHGTPDAKTRWNMVSGERATAGNATPNNPFGNTPSGVKQALDSVGKPKDEVEDQKELLSKLGWDYINPSEYSPETIGEVIAEKRAYYNHAEYIQNGIKMASVADPESDLYDPEFELYAQKGKELGGGKPWEFFGTYLGDNEVEDIRNYFEDGEMSSGRSNRHNMILAMNEEEVSIYNYYLGKYGKEKAESYLSYLESTLNARYANHLHGEIDSKIESLFFASVVGLDQFATGMRDLVNTSDSYIPTSPYQQASAMVGEDMAEAGWGWKAAYDLISTTSNMAPSIITSAALSYVNPVLGQVAGSALIGASASGNAYAEAINLGYTKEQARGYSLLVGGSEAGLQYLLGGIGSLGGAATKGLTAKIATKLASNFDRAFAKIAVTSGVKLVGGMVSEFGEEYLQEILNPVFKNIALNTNEDFKLYTPEALYAGFLGALSAGLLEGGSTISGEISTYIAGKDVIAAKQTDGLAKLGLSYSADTVAYKIASQVNENTDAYTLGQLLHEVGADHLSAENIADITAELTNRGIALNNAQSIAKWLNKAVEGEYFSKGQISALENNEIISEVFRDVIINENSSVNQRVQGFKNINDAVKKGKPTATADIDVDTNEKTASSQSNFVPLSAEQIETVAKVYEAMGMPYEQAKSMAVAQFSDSTIKVTSSEQNATEGKFEVSDDGKTVNTKTGDAVEVVNISGISDSGEVDLTLKDGTVVKASDISFGNPAEAAFVGYISELKLGKNAISAETANNLYQAAMSALRSNPDMTVSEASSLIRGLAEAYTYGAYSFGEERLTETDENGKAKRFAGELTDTQRRFAYELGKKDRAAKVEAEQKAITEAKGKAKPSKKHPGKIVFENGINVNESDLSDFQKANLEGIKLLAEISSIEFHIYQTEKVNGKWQYTMADGTVVGANGWYVAGTNEIWVDLNAGEFGEGAMIRTAAHEISHYIKEKSPKQWQAMADLLMQTFAENDVDVESMLNRQIAKIKRRYKANKDAVPSQSALREMAYEELVSDALSDMLTDGSIVNFIAEVKAKDQSLEKRILEAIKNLLKKWGLVVDSYKGKDLDTDEAKALSQFEDTFKKLQEMYRNAFMDANEVAKAQKNTAKEGDVKKSDRITSNMSDSERADILRDKIITNVPMVKDLSADIVQKFENISSWEDINNLFGSKKSTLIQKLVSEFGVFKRYSNADINISFEFSKNNFRESYHKQKANYERFAKMFSVFDSVVKNAVGIEAHNRNSDGYKPDVTLKNVYVLMSAFEDGDLIIPVKLEVKEFKDKQNTLYVAISLEGIKKAEVSKQGTTENGVAQNSRSATIIICDLFSKINPKDINFLKYIPNEFLTKEQIAEKETVKENSKKLSDRDSAGNTLTAEQQRYFAESKIRDDNGNLKVMYQGAQSEFYEFDRKKSSPYNLYGRGFYFTDSKSRANQYGTAREYYLNIKNPVPTSKEDSIITREQMRKYLEAVAENEDDYDIWNYGTTDIDVILDKVFDGRSDFAMLQDISATAIGDLVAAIELFNEVNGTSFDGIDLATETVIFNSEQAKLTTNKKPTSNTDIRYSERDYPIDPDVDNTVKTAYTKPNGKMHELSEITSDQNKAINRLVNQSGDNSYQGKYTGGKHRFSDTAVRHIIAEHGDFLREGLRAQLPMTLTDVSRHLSAIKDNKNPSSIKASRTKRGLPSILTSYEVNGYTLYAEEITKSLGKNLPSDLIGHTMYKAPTLATAAALATSARALPKRQSEVLCKYYMPNSNVLSTENFVADKNGNPALLKFISKSNSPKADVLLGGLIPLSSDVTNFTDKSGQVDQGYVRCKKPFYITQENRVFSNSETNVAQKIEELKKQGYDCFIFDKTVGDNYMIAVVNKAQIIKNKPTRIFSDRDSAYLDAVSRGDTEAEERMVYEAAKSAGYPTKVMHGTPHFGFTRLDVTKSDDGMSFFATDSLETASTYSPTEGARRIGNAALKASSKEFSKALNDVKTDLSSCVEHIKSQYGVDVSEFIGRFEAVLNEPTDNAKTELDIFSKANSVLGDLAEAVKTELYNRHQSDPSNKKMSLKKFEDSNYWRSVVDENNAFYDKIVDNLQKMFGENEGIYELYANTDGHLVIDCNGRNWNNIKSDALPWRGVTNRWTTRSVVQYAKDKGYTGVTFKNLRDSGDDSANVKPATVYAFFKPQEQLKSADPVTYDDEGNVIPLSERFDKNNDDIRRSERDSSTSTRSLLANALEGAVQNDIERKKLNEYKEKIALLDSEQQKLTAIQKQLFTKGAVDPATRKKLQLEAKQISNRINIYDRQLLNLEATKALKNVLAREKTRARKRQKEIDNMILQGQKDKAAAKQRELMDRYKESRRKATESRHRTAMRHKIKTVVNDLNNLLLKPSKERHVPEELRIAVAEALSIINMDTVGADERVAKYNALIAKANDPDIIASLTETRDRILAQGNKLSEKLTKLKEAYEMVRDSTDDSLSSIYDEVIYNKIGSVQKKIGKTSLRDMTLEQLESVYELYTAVLTIVRNSNKAFAEDLKLTRQALGSNTFTEIKENNKSRDRIKYESAEKFWWQNLKPMQAMKKIGSATLQKLWNNILYGQEVFARDYDEAVKFAKEMKEKYGYEKWDLNKLYSFESKSGKPMKINLEQMMSIYAYSKRAQADEHIEYGGIVLNEGVIKEKNKLGKVVEVKVNDSTAYRLNRMQVGEIVATLEKEFPGAKEFVDEMQKYLSETMGEKGNEVSMKMYGIKLFKESHYFPLKSSKDFMEAANAKLKGDVKIKNKGMTKSTVEHARNPIVLENFLDVWGNHVNEMGMYHGLVLPLEDFSRTLNYSFQADENLNTDAESVRTALHDAFGDSADNYLNELLKAINGGVLHDSSAGFADRMISKFKKAKVMASLSVIVQQPTAIIRAMGIIEPKYFVAQNFKHKATWEELKKYCPTAIIKETGSFDTNMGRTIVDMIKDDRGFTDKVGDLLGKAPAYMDEMGWNMIWRALKNKVATEQKLSGEALLEECGKQMTLIINETQVYDSVMARNELMRSKSVFTKMATAFMAEPSTVANMIYGAALDAKRGKKGIATKTVAAVVSSVVVNGLVSAMVYALRDDDEDETFLEKYISSATTEVLDGLNPLTYIPFVKDAYSLFQGYKVERTDLALIGDVYDALNTFYNVLDSEVYEGMSGKEIANHIYENSVPLLTSVCDMFGLPVGNVLRDAKSVIVNDSLPLSQTSSSGTKYAFKEGLLSTLPKIVQKIIGEGTKQDKLYEAIIDGDTAYIDRLKSGYKDDEAYETALRKALRENDPRIKDAAKAHNSGNFRNYSDFIDAIVTEGHFDEVTVKDAILAEEGAFNTKVNKAAEAKNSGDDEEYKRIVKELRDFYKGIYSQDEIVNLVKRAQDEQLATDDDEEVEEATSIYKASDINVAFENGDTDSAVMIIDDIVRIKTENYIADGETEKDAKAKAQASVKASMTAYWKPLYIAAYHNKDNEETKRIRYVLRDSGLYGRSANEIMDVIKGWLKSIKK